MYGALDIRDMIATVSMQHIQHRDLALALFAARVCGVVFYNQAQVQQYNVLSAGMTEFKVDLSKLPSDYHGLYAFVTTINKHKVKSVFSQLMCKDVAEEIKYEIQKRLDDPRMAQL